MNNHPPHGYIPAPHSSADMDLIIQLSMKEILGCSEAEMIINHPSFLPGDINSLQPILDELYGSPAGSGLAVRIGRASFKHILHTYGPRLGLDSSSFRLLPWKARVSKGSEILTGLLEGLVQENMELEQADHSFTWKIKRREPKTNQVVEDQAGKIMAGILQEALSWMSAGRYFTLEERFILKDNQSAHTIKVDLNTIE